MIKKKKSKIRRWLIALYIYSLNFQIFNFLKNSGEKFQNFNTKKAGCGNETNLYNLQLILTTTFTKFIM